MHMKQLLRLSVLVDEDWFLIPVLIVCYYILKGMKVGKKVPEPSLLLLPLLLCMFSFA